ncbi:LPS-assembly protein LptD [Pseudotabrizicola sp. L79]|uniref:LPS-assembly protein LptD n=1 Tax=Pseudotabrizicola sp. L79 TaxID=3118402 RepID=UPI002F932877
MLRRVLILLLCSVVLGVSLGSPGMSQDRAALVADAVSVDPSGRLVASGGVEVFYQGRRLRATRIVYDRADDSLLIEGPIVLVDGTDTILIASQAELSADLNEGILTSARLVLNRELQMAATQIQRIGGRYMQLDNVVASSCKVCEGDPTPLWEIRARKVVHDQQERQIYFDQAQFRVAGLPVAWFPRLRMPDPTLKRATGVLMPSFRTTTSLGTGIKLPYFITLGPHRDLTVTPYFSTKSGRTVELRYRQAFASGTVELNGAVSRDEIVPGETRYYLTAEGEFALPRDFTLTFDGVIVSDAGYLLDYGLGDEDRLESRMDVSRTSRNEYISGRLVGIRSIREGETNSTLPTIISDFTFHRRFSGGPLGGEAGLKFQTHSHYRSSDDGSTDSDGDGISDGRDVARASLRLDWRRNWQLPMGMVGTVLGEVRADAYRISQDDTYGGGTTRLHGGLGAELRWPWQKTGASGVSHVIEPVAQFVWAPKGVESLPNEDSRLVEFDESSLFSLNRFPGSDAVERGGHLNLGVTYTRYDPAGWTLSTTLGRVFRDSDLGQFSQASGLDGQQSDWLATLQLSLPQGLSFGHRMLIDDTSSLNKAESQISLQRDRYSLTGSYVWIIADTDEDRPDPISELLLDGSYKLTDNWTAFGQTRYDFEADRANRASVGLQFRNECVSVDLSLSRRFTSSTSVTPTTDFGLAVDLVGLGSGISAGPSRACRR